ncbi:neural-cadherin-like [Protopterus annectens]|uniref:neural-cadherin-like n=1 Tax=Protopterus annectens TaxID=7888 RepID=UPI001CF9F086|nr:neural-cadherin-like [Protopterus annectens]
MNSGCKWIFMLNYVLGPSILTLFLLTSSLNATHFNKLLFYGLVHENVYPGTRVSGISIPLKRISPERWCIQKGSDKRFQLKLEGENKSRFQLYFHHSLSQVALKTTEILDREVQSVYTFELRLCCTRCLSGDNHVIKLATITVNVLDSNDNLPKFTYHDKIRRIELQETCSLKSVVHRLTAIDADLGKNAELVYFAFPANSFFYVVPKTGEVVVLDSLLNVRRDLRLHVFARDRGDPALVGGPAVLIINPQRRYLNGTHSEQRLKTDNVLIRPPRSLLQPESPLTVSIREDAPVGSSILTLTPIRFGSARFELVSPTEERSPVCLDEETGEMRLSRTLDRETEPNIELVVKIQDVKGKDWYLMWIDLVVTDVNDNAPEWLMSPVPFLAAVSTDAPEGTSVYRLLAQDRDEGINGQLQYFLIEGGDGRFAVDSESGVIRTTGVSLVKETEYLLTVLVVDKLGYKGPPAVVSITAGPRAPQFTNLSYLVHIPEGTPEGQPFLTVSATSFQKKELSYTILINPSSLFNIHRETGEISLTRSVDYETDPQHYVLLVKATEKGEQFSCAAEVLVAITDVNDCVPEFLQSVYTQDNVPETVTTTTSLIQVSTTDCDSGVNADIVYYTLSPDFSISPDGVILPARQLDYEKPNHMYEFVVVAVDKGEVPNTATATVRIRMSNVNDEAPVFSQTVYRTFVSEDARPNTLVATVHATDPDSDGVTYAITAGNEDGNFVIDKQKGLIRLRSSPFPQLHLPEYVLSITATDDNASGGPQPLMSTAKVIVGVDDINNNKPVFEKCQYYNEHASVVENQPSGTFVLQVQASDADEGANGDVKYGIMHRDGSIPAFWIHPETGIITTLQSFDREQQRDYAVTVTAMDQAAEPLIGICLINIEILDENDNTPIFENMRYEYFLREDTAVGTSFLRVAAQDEDYGTNATVSYVMAEGPKYFQVNPFTGWVYVNQPISQRSYITQHIVATDGGNRSTKAELSVTITNVQNQPPVWEKESYEAVIPENAVRDTVVVMIRAFSPLGDPRVTYHLEEGLVPETNIPVRFYLMPNREDGSAAVLVAEALDFETTKTFILRVRAQNIAAMPMASFTTVYINITDVNDNVPFFTSSVYEALLAEGSDIGTFVLQVSATDLDTDQNGKITYFLLEDRNKDYRFFRLDPDTGSLYAEAEFDREFKGTYLLEVMSRDGTESARPGKPEQPNSDTAYVRIFITDVNDNKPVFTQSVYEVTVDEDQDVGFTVISISAIDNDEDANAKLRYQIMSGNVNGVFNVEPEAGTIFISQSLDFERAQRYELHLLASDGKWEDYAVVAISVTNKNDEAPVFSKSEYYGSVIEELDGSPIFVLQVTANDPDEDADQGALKYTLHGHGVDSEFRIDEDSGIIYAQKKLNREDHAVWRFVVLATDENGEGLTGFADVIINVWDVNDNHPVFTCMPDNCNGNVLENSPADTSIMEMTATDLDEPNTSHNAILTYKIVHNVQNGNNLDLFTVNPSTGTIYVALGNLDREKSDKYYLTVESRDGGGLSGTGTATIFILDVNDHAPKFTQQLWSAVILENSDVNTEVVTMSATDADIGENALLTFTIISGDPEQKFYIENYKKEKQGVIRLRKQLDYENVPERLFNLTIRVEDLDFSSTAHCVVEIIDCNDHAPVFVPRVFHANPFYENVSIGTVVAMMVASDADSGMNGKIIYRIQSESDHLGQFIINQLGHVIVSDKLDREAIQHYSLIILATDQGSPVQTGSATVELTLLDVNDNGPEFEATYMPIVWENKQGPQVVRVNQTSLLLYAVDHDTEGGPPFFFTLPFAYQNFSDFSLTDNRNNTATIMALRSFDREEQKEFILPVIIKDSGNPPMSATNTLTISIGDENDHAHCAGHKEIYVNNYEGKMPTTVLGKIHAPDPDDWDNKTYTFERQVSKHFILNQRTGLVMIKANAPSGDYDFKVRVSDGVWPDVVSTVRVFVNELTDEDIYNSGSVRITNITAQEFIQEDRAGKSKYNMFKNLLGELLLVPPDHVSILNVKNRNGRVTDIRFSAHSSIYFSPEKLLGTLSSHKTRVQSDLKVNISQIHIDECMNIDCHSTGGCSNHLQFSDEPVLVDAGNVAFVSITLATHPVCTCTSRERIHHPCTWYPKNPCHNGGTCSSSSDGYRCHCPSQYTGPDCQQTKHSFLGNGYAWFPPIKPCFESHLSLEYITEVPDGLLLYNGPISNPEPGEPEDFIATELDGGVPVLKINHGSGILVLRLPSSINTADRRWHRLDIKSNGKTVSLTLDRCSEAKISEAERGGKQLSTEDRSSCEVTGSTPNEARYLNVNHVLQLGGVKESVPYSYPQLQFKHFTGCIRNLILDSKVFDLETPAESQNSFPGCVATDGNCYNMGSSLCGTHGQCYGEWGAFSCHCLPGYYGHKCDKAVNEYSFEPGSYVMYQMRMGIPTRRTYFQAIIRTRTPNSIVMSMSSRDQKEYITLQVSNGFFAVSYNLGDADHFVKLPSYRIDNGDWHLISLERIHNEFTLKINGGGGKREINRAYGTFREIIIDPDSLILGNFHPVSHNRSFQGCIKDVRFNHHQLHLDTDMKGLISIVALRGVREGCFSEACKSNPCQKPFVCHDLWRMHDCRCPPGHMVVQNSSGKYCIYTLCANRPCHPGTCVAQSPSKFSCDCPEGYSGRHCEITLAVYHDEVGLSFSSMFAICICFLALLVLISGLIIWTCWKNYEHIKGSYEVNTYYSDWEDLRENVLNYDEEGGGEADQVVYNMKELRMPLQPISPQSLLRNLNGTKYSQLSERYDSSLPQKLLQKCLNYTPISDDSAYCLSNHIRKGDNYLQALSQDSLQVYCTEGDGSQAGSLSSLESSESAEDFNYDHIGDWGPKFETLRALYSHVADEVQSRETCITGYTVLEDKSK